MISNEFSCFVFNHPFKCIISGPSMSGKTTLLKNILFNINELMSVNPEKIVYCYSRWQSNFEELKSNLAGIVFQQGLPDIENFDKNFVNLLILDDLMTEGGNDKTICDMFTVDSHHKNISVFFLTQNMFCKEKNFRTINLNANYNIIKVNKRDRSQINYLARQMYPKSPNFLIECYLDAVQKPYGYLFIDCHPKSDERLQVQSGILPNEERIVYEIKDEYK